MNCTNQSKPISLSDEFDESGTPTMASPIPTPLSEERIRTPSIDKPASLYLWMRNTSRDYRIQESIAYRVPSPDGFIRIHVKAGSFGEWLRYLPLKERNAPISFYSGRLKRDQSIHYAVIDIDVGEKDLQQCADAVIRLHAEYLYSSGQKESIRYHFTSGDRIAFRRWIQGDRPVVKGNQVRWRSGGHNDSSYPAFREYLNTIFLYAGTYSLEREMEPAMVDEMRIGDVFIQGGFPGHAVIVVDMAVNPATNENVFLLAQSFMPAQDIHVLVNPNDRGLNPWYAADFGETLYTPEWTFGREDLRRFSF